MNSMKRKLLRALAILCISASAATIATCLIVPMFLIGWPYTGPMLIIAVLSSGAWGLNFFRWDYDR